MVLLTFPEQLLHPEDPEDWCCSCPRSQSWTNTHNVTQAKVQLFKVISSYIPPHTDQNNDSIKSRCSRLHPSKLLLLCCYVITFWSISDILCDQWTYCITHLSLELICSALASILAPMSPMAFPLMSSLVSEELLPRALRTMVRSLFSLESARDREVRGCGREGWRDDGEKKNIERVYIMRTRGKVQSYCDWLLKDSQSLSATCRLFSSGRIDEHPSSCVCLCSFDHHQRTFKRTFLGLCSV